MRLPTAPRLIARRRRGKLLKAVLVLGLLAAVITTGLFYGYRRSTNRAARPDLIVAPVSSGPFNQVVLEQGEIESSSNVEVVCHVRSRGGASGTGILWVIDEGAAVKEGDKLVELDDSAWVQALRDKRIVVIGAEAEVAAAEAAVEQAKIARQEYLEGLFETEERAIQSEMAIAQQDLRKAQLALQSSERLVARGLVKSLQLEADQFAVANARNVYESAKNRLRVLQDLTRRKMLVEFDSAIEAAEAQLAASMGALEEEQSDLADIQKQIELCTIHAPADGVVIHANTYSRRGGTEEVIEPGAIIRERQTILRLPDPSRMQVKASVNESRITMIQPGMPAKIRVESVKNLELLGRVTRVNQYAEPSSWYNSSVKEYATIIEIIDPPESIRTGMTAEVQIFVEQLPDATQVPIQALYEHGGKLYTLVKRGLNAFETREVAIGATNDKRATITSGVETDETVVLNLRQNLSLLDLPNVEQGEDQLLTQLVSDAGPLPPNDNPQQGGGGSERGGQRSADADQRRGAGEQPRGRPATEAGAAGSEAQPSQPQTAERGQDEAAGEQADRSSRQAVDRVSETRREGESGG